MITLDRFLVKTGTALAMAVAVACSTVPTTAAADGAKSDHGRSSSCQLDPDHGRIKHVIYIQFDNVHLTRDNPNVPSDLEQMPSLYGFLTGNGTLVQKSYTVLISHTAGGITSSLTGLYPDRMGINESNSYDYYDPSTGLPTFTSAFKYWTAPVAGPGGGGRPTRSTRRAGTPA